MILGVILRSTLPFLKGVCKFLHRVSAWLLSRYSGFVQTGNSKSSTGVSASVKRLYLLALHRTAASSKVCNSTCNPETAVTDSLRPRVPEPTTADDEGSAFASTWPQFTTSTLIRWQATVVHVGVIPPSIYFLLRLLHSGSKGALESILAVLGHSQFNSMQTDRWIDR